jgi:putative two-component system response regulator
MGRDYILCVDDEAIILSSLKVEFRNEFGRDMDIEIALSGPEALALADELAAEGRQPVLAVSDQRMPEMDGSEFLARLKRKYPDTQCIMLTGYSEVDAIKRAINEAGLFRFISKPWSSLDLRMAARQAVDHRRLDLLNRSLLHQLEVMNRTILSTLESVVDANDPETHDHVRRVSIYATAIAKASGQDLVFQRKIFVFSPLHDIGKVGIRHEILAKPGPLDDRERSEIKTHVAIGARLLRDIDVEPILREIVGFHHEKWDGTGYAAGLAGVAIPLAARIVALADVFDVLLSDRPYKKAYPFETALEIVKAGRGGHFDPGLVDALLGCGDLLRSIPGGDVTEALLGELVRDGPLPTLLRNAAVPD